MIARRKLAHVCSYSHYFNAEFMTKYPWICKERLIATLGMMTVVRGLTDVYTNAVVVVGPTSVLGPDNFGVIGLGEVAGIPVAVYVILGLLTGLRA